MRVVIGLKPNSSKPFLLSLYAWNRLWFGLGIVLIIWTTLHVAIMLLRVQKNKLIIFNCISKCFIVISITIVIFLLFPLITGIGVNPNSAFPNGYEFIFGIEFAEYNRLTYFNISQTYLAVFSALILSSIFFVIFVITKIVLDKKKYKKIKSKN